MGGGGEISCGLPLTKFSDALTHYTVTGMPSLVHSVADPEFLGLTEQFVCVGGGGEGHAISDQFVRKTSGLSHL